MVTNGIKDFEVFLGGKSLSRQPLPAVVVAAAWIKSCGLKACIAGHRGCRMCARMQARIALLLLAGSIAALAQQPVCNIVSFGAKNDASARSTAAIKAAVQSCVKGGGGTVYVPPGTYDTGAIELASNIVLHIEAGVTLRFHTDLAEYPIVPGRLEGT